MSLAGILALCLVLYVPPREVARSAVYVLPPQANSTQSSQESKSQEATPPASQEPTPPSGATEHSAPAAPSKPSSSKATTHRKKKVASPPSPDPAPSKKVVSHGSTEAHITQLSGGMTKEQADKVHTEVASLVSLTDANLQKISSRLLTPDEQETVGQIRKFMEQAKAADQEGDLDRARSLANKGKLLSEALLKP